jgi:hypothetical protein
MLGNECIGQAHYQIFLVLPEVAHTTLNHGFSWVSQLGGSKKTTSRYAPWFSTPFFIFYFYFGHLLVTFCFIFKIYYYYYYYLIIIIHVQKFKKVLAERNKAVSKRSVGHDFSFNCLVWWLGRTIMFLMWSFCNQSTYLPTYLPSLKIMNRD